MSQLTCCISTNCIANVIHWSLPASSTRHFAPTTGQCLVSTKRITRATWRRSNRVFWMAPPSGLPNWPSQVTIATIVLVLATIARESTNHCSVLSVMWSVPSSLLLSYCDADLWPWDWPCAVSMATSSWKISLRLYFFPISIVYTLDV